MKFADRLKAWRKAAKLSQSQAAEQLAISCRTLQEWEQERSEPSHPGPILRLMAEVSVAEHKAKRRKRA